MYIVLLKNGILCRYLSVPLDLRCYSLLECLDDLYLTDIEVLTSPTTTMLGSICDVKSFSICLMKLVAPTLGTFKLIIIISS
jgi:hypothetical protein